MVSLAEVFGITSSVPTHTYVDRQGLDGRFKYALEADRYIIIYGASKQGKTSLRRKQLPERQCVVVPCKPDFRVEDLYTEIRRQLHLTDITQEKSSTTISTKISAEAKGKAGIPLFAEGQAGGAAEGSFVRNTETYLTPVPDELSIPSLAEQVKQQEKRIIIEDFHYLSEPERHRLAFDLKAFWDLRVFFIIIGVWAEQNLLTTYNNDLSGRVEEIDVQWDRDDLHLVLAKGEQALLIMFDEPIKESIIADASGNVGLLQRFAEKICYNSGIYGSDDVVRTITDANVVDQCRAEICASQENRYHSFVELIGKGFKDPERTKLKMYHHLVRVCFEASEHGLLAGIDRQIILLRIQGVEPDANMNVLSAALSRLNRLQSERKISPPVL
jgi:hypothetical protein